MALRNLLVRVGADLSGMTKGFKKAQSDTKKFSSNIKASFDGLEASIAKIGAIIGGGFVIGKAIQDASKLEANMATLRETLGSSTDDFVKWQESTGRAFGFSRLQSAQLANTLSINFKGIATSQKDLLDKTTKMMETAGIVAQKRGMDMQEVSDRIRSAMNGEADGADELGVNIRVTSQEMTEAIAKYGNGKHWEDMDTNMQKAIRYHSVLDQVAKNLGTTLADTTASRMAIFRASLGDLSVALGNVFLPVLYKVLPYLTAFADRVARALNMVGGFLKALFGIKGKFGGNETQKQTTKENQAYGNQAKAVDGVSKSLGNLKKAKKSASASVAGFDEVNTLSSADDGGADGGGAGGAGGSVLGDIANEANNANNALNPINETLDKMQAKFEAMVKPIKEWFAPIGEALSNLWDSLQHLGDSIANVWNSEGFKNFREWVAGVVQWAIVESIETLKNRIDELADFIQIIADILNGDWGKAWEDTKKLLDDTNPLVAGIVASLTTFFVIMEVQKVLEFVKALEAWKTIQLLLNGELTIMNLLMNLNPIGMIIIGVGALVGTIILLYQNWDTVNKYIQICWDWLKTLGSTIAGFWDDFITGLSKAGTEIANFGKAIGDWFIGGMKDTGQTFANMGKTIWGWIVSAFNGVSDWWTKTVVPQFTEAIKSLSNIGSTIWGYVKAGFSAVKDWFATNVVGQYDKNTGIAGAFHALANVGGQIWGWVKSGFSAVKDWFNTNVVGSYAKGTGIAGAFHALNGLGSTIWGYLKSGFTSVKTWFTTNVASPIKSAFSNITSGLGSAITSAFKTVYNKAVGFLNDMIDKVNDVGDSIDKYISGDAIKHIPHIPKLARGGIVTSPTTARIGERGAEAVAPLDQLAGMISSAVASAMSFNKGASAGGDIILQVDGKQLAKIMKPLLDQEQQRIGTNIRLQSI